MDRGARSRREATVSGHVVHVIVGLQRVLDTHAHVPRQREVVLDLELRVDDRGDACVLVADQIRSAAEVVVDELTEITGSSSLPAAARNAPRVGQPRARRFMPPVMLATSSRCRAARRAASVLR